MVNPGDRIQHYEIVRLLGKGGMGEVYLARDTVLERNVALKFLPDELETDARMRERFLREAKSAAALDHPFICKIYETGSYQGKGYIAMEFVDGETLKDRMQRERVPLKEAIRITLEIGEALENAHKAGIVHRDLKPANIMLSSQGHTKVMDFGLAKHVLPGTDASGVSRTITQQSLTEHGAIAGTIAYMSPEQAKGGALDGRSDIFSLGIILYEMITGANPFSKPTPIETLTSILRDAAPATHVTPKSVNPLLNPIVHKALSKNPEERYLKIGDFVADLQKAYREVGGGGRLFSRRALVVGGAVLAVALGAFVIDRIVRRPSSPSEKAGPKSIKVLIADFDNKTGDPVFDGALEQTFAIGLEGASFITVYDRAQARDLSKKINTGRAGRLDRSTALLLSQREGINVVVCATIESVSGDKGYAIQVEALDATSNKRLSQTSRTIGTKAEVPAAAGVLAAKLRADLEGVPAGSVESMSRETFTASSLEAMQAYQAAQDFANRGRDDDAIREYRKAVELDPKLGRAYAGLAVVYRNRGDLEESKRYYEKAMPLLDQMTEREKYRTRGGYYFVNRNFKKAIEEYRALEEKFPADPAGYTNLSLAYFYARDMGRAFEEGRKAVDVSPGLVTPLYNLAWYAICAGKFDEAEANAMEVVKLDSSFAEAHICLALIDLFQGKNAEAAAEYRRIEGLGAYAASLAASGRTDLALYEGRLEDARKILEEAAAADAKNDLKAMASLKEMGLAQTLLAQGKVDLAVKRAERVLAGSRNETVLFSAGMLFAEAGRVDQAMPLAEELDKRLQPEPQAYAKIIEGEIFLKKGRMAESIKAFHEAKEAVDTWIGHLELGRAYLAAGQFTEAHSEFELCLTRRGEAASLFLDDLPTLRYLPQVYYDLGRAQEGLKIPAAKDSYKKFLEIKILAAGDPLVEDAKRRLGQL